MQLSRVCVCSDGPLVITTLKHELYHLPFSRTQRQAPLPIGTDLLRA